MMRSSASQPAGRPRWISFDCYGTLIDWEGGIRRAFREIVRVTPGDETEIFPVWESIQWKMIQEPYRPYAEILADSFRLAVEEFGYRWPAYASEAFLESLAGWEPFADTSPALFRLSQRYRLAIISNIDRELLGRTLRQFPVRFDVLVTAEDARCYKPNPEIFRLALERLACPAQEVAHVAFGDAYDLRPARSVGMRPVYLNRNGLPLPEVELEAAISSLKEVAGLWEPGGAGLRAGTGKQEGPAHGRL